MDPNDSSSGNKSNGLKKLLSNLKESSSSAVADGMQQNIDEIKSYLHIERPIQYELQKLFEAAKESNKKQLILVCGNVGDGKSHLISFLQKEWPELQSDFKIINDATESTKPDRTFLEELYKVLDPFQDENLDTGNDKIILAINLGTLNNFLTDCVDKPFSTLKKYVENKNILEVSIIENNHFDTSSHFQFVNFCDHNLFKLTPDGPDSSHMIEEAIKRIVKPNSGNPFWKAFEERKQTHPINCPICYNYQLLQDPKIQSLISGLLIECIVRNNLIVSIRALYNFIYDLIVPIDLTKLKQEDEIEQINSYSDDSFLSSLIPNYIFEHPELSPIFSKLQEIDPATKRSELIDNATIALMVSDKKDYIFKKYVTNGNVGKEFIEAFCNLDDKNNLKIKSFIRAAFFCDEIHQFDFKSATYESFMKALYDWYSGNTTNLRPVYTLMERTIQNWFGSCPKDHINFEVGRQQLHYRVCKKIILKPSPENAPPPCKENIQHFQSFLPLGFKVHGINKMVEVPFKLFELSHKMANGYCPTIKDHANFISFSKAIEKISETENDDDGIFFLESTGNKKFKLERDWTGAFCFGEVTV